jgi:hypothetical protein
MWARHSVVRVASEMKQYPSTFLHPSRTICITSRHMYSSRLALTCVVGVCGRLPFWAAACCGLGCKSPFGYPGAPLRPVLF